MLRPAEEYAGEVLNLAGQLALTEQTLRTLVERLADEQIWHESTREALSAAQKLLEDTT